MAHLFKPQIVYYVDGRWQAGPVQHAGCPQGGFEESRKWYAKGTPLPKGQKVPLASDKRAALQLLAKLEADIERGETPIGGTKVKAARLPIGEHLDAFEAHLKASGEVGAEHLGKKMSKLRRIAAGCKHGAAGRPDDHESGKVPGRPARATAGRFHPWTRPGRRTPGTSWPPPWASSRSR